MQTRVFWIIEEKAGGLGIMPRPSGGALLDEELLALQSAGVSIVVSLLTETEQRELSLVRECELCEEHEMQFISFPTHDRAVPHRMDSYLQLVQSLSASLREGRNVVIHCRMGIGRAALVAAGVLVLQGSRADEAFARISAVRGCTVPDTDEQRRWLQDAARHVRSLAV